MKERRVALYLRTSTADRQDTAGQESELRGLAERRGWTIHKIYRDHGHSGVKVSRPAFDEMFDDCRRGRIDVVSVWALDRFGRSLKNVIQGLEELQRLGVDFVCLRQDLDSSTPAGKLFFHIVAAFGEFEHEILRSRIEMGMEQARREGKHIGRPPKRRFSTSELQQIQMERAREQTSIRQLSLRYGATQWMIARILATNS